MTASTLVSSVVLDRYAGALVDLAEESKAVSKIQKDLAALESVISESDDLQQFISSPSVSREKQHAVIAEVIKKAKLQKLTANFLGVLVENRRINILPQVITAFNKEIAKRSGQVEVKVQTAAKITAAQTKTIEKKISASLGVDVIVEASVTPEIIGGMVVTIGSYMIDDSVRRKVERLGSALKSNSNQKEINLKEVV